MIYLLDSSQLAVMKSVMKRLYGNGTTLSPDARRDLANTLEYVLYKIEELGPVEESAIKETK